MKSKCTNENVMLSVDVLHRHPQNPRKGVGDVTELADSIKKNGVMQNLTVIPGYWDGSGNHHDEEYTLLIGHRRFTAAKLAGITELPCRIIEGMSEKEQIGYDYDAAVEKCRKKVDKRESNSDVGEDALLLALKRSNAGKVSEESKEKSNDSTPETQQEVKDG